MALGQSPVSQGPLGDNPDSSTSTVVGQPSIDLAALTQWLRTDAALRVILIEADVLTGGVETTRYLSNKGYVTGNNDVPANTVYLPLIAGGVQFTEQIALDGSVSISFGDFALYNKSGDKDAWFDDIWENRSIKIFVGDMSWSRSQFVKVFDGIIAQVNSSQRDRLNLVISDKLQRLNTVVSNAVLGGTTSNAGKFIPLLFGECFNIEPLLVDPANLVYQIHVGPIEQIIEVRDNGVPVKFTPLLSQGQFALNQQPVGTITCSAQGDNPGTYANDLVSLVIRLATAFGQVDQRLSTSDLDMMNLTAFQTAHMQPMGIYLSDKANVLDVCNQLATSIGARVLMTKTGLLRIVQLNLDFTTTGTVVTESDVVEKSLYISSMPPVIAGVNLGYCKNWCVQTALQTGLPNADIFLFGVDQMTTLAMDGNTSNTYKLFTTPDPTETMLLTLTDASAEANRQLRVFNTQRKIFHYTGLPQLLTEQLGDPQTIQNWRFGLQNGKTGQITSVMTDWTALKVEIEVLI